MESLVRRPFLVNRSEPDWLASFAAAVAHDLNDHLTVILNSTVEILGEEHLEAPTRAAVKDLESAALRCAGISENLLALTRRRGGDGTVQLGYFLGAE